MSDKGDNQAVLSEITVRIIASGKQEKLFQLYFAL